MDIWWMKEQLMNGHLMNERTINEWKNNQWMKEQLMNERTINEWKNN